MKRVIQWAAMLCCCLGLALHAQPSQQLTGVQYYYNTDPGLGVNGNGGVVNLTATDTLSQQFSFSLPPSITSGVNYLYIRVRDQAGTWSQATRRSFYVLTVPPTLQDVSAIQYYYDTDPGLGITGNGGVASLSPTDSLQQTFSFNLDPSLGVGIHYLYIRVQNQNGTWSLATRKAFYVFAPAALGSDVDAVQYYFDTDPGLGVAGNGGIVSVTPTDSLSQNFSFNVPGNLSEGIHYLHIRSRNQDGRWSLMTTRAFVVHTPSTQGSPVAAMEYYYDNDPGLGMANPIVITPGDTVTAIYPITAPCLSTGDHYMYVRAQNSAGVWSLVDTDTIGITAGTDTANVTPAGPQAICQGDSVELSFVASPGVSYQWRRNGVDIPGADSTSYFADTTGNYSVRSSCGATFAVSNTVMVSFQSQINYYADADNDGFGDPLNTIFTCSPLVGYVTNALDCDDGDSTIRPGAVEVCNGIDDDCDGFVDEGVRPVVNLFPAICEGDSVLIYGVYRFLPGTYRDTVTTNGCDSITNIFLTVRLVDSITVNTTTTNPSMTGIFDTTYTNRFGCDSVVTTVVTLDPGPCPPDSTIVNLTTCDSTMAGITMVTLTNQQGCDSVVTTVTTYLPSSLTILPNVVICQGQSVVILGVSRSADGIYTDTLTAANGCDSVLQQTLVVNPSYLIVPPPLAICQGDSTLIGGVYRTTSGTYTDSLTSVNGCDSVIISQLQVDTLILTFSSLSICDGDSALIQGAYQTMAGTFVDTGQSQSGCDSIHTTNLFVIPVATVISNLVICQGDSILINGIYRFSSGSFTSLFTSVNGCDSSVITNLTVSPPVVNAVSASICQGDSLLLGGVYQTTAGIYYDTLSTATGCDSVLITTLSVLPSVTVNTAASICIGDSILLGGSYQTASGVYTDVFTAANGCDSLLVTTLTVYPFYSTTTNLAICQGDSVLLAGAYRNSSGVYTDSALTVNGCDSITITVLTVAPSINSSVSLAICDGDSVLIAGLYQSMAGTYVDSFISTGGCDSIVTTTLTVNPTYLMSAAASFCDGDSALLGGSWQTITGTYFDSLQTQQGCDSVIVTSLTVLPSAVITTTDSLCPGDSLLVGSVYRYSPGTYTNVYTAANGCDSTVVTTLSFRTALACGGTPPTVIDSIYVVSDTGWRKSTVVTTAGVVSYPWLGVIGLPGSATFTLPVEIGQPYGYKSIEYVPGAEVIKAGSNITYYRKTFNLSVDTGVMARFRSYMDDGMEIYINGYLLAREDDRSVFNAKGVGHDLVFNPNGTLENGYMGNDAFDMANAYKLDDVVQVGQNEIIVVIRNFPNDLGGFSFRMDLKTNLPASAVLLSHVVSDIGWSKSTVNETATSGLYPWPGAQSLPATATYTLPVEIGQPYPYKSVFEVPESQPLKATADVTFYRTTFELSDNTGLTARFRTTFNDNVEIYVNGQLMAREKDMGRYHGRNDPPHDLLIMSNGTSLNGYLGGKSFDIVSGSALSSIFQVGTNEVVVALRNRPTDVGGFSFRMDLDQSGANVIVQKDVVTTDITGLDFGFNLYPNPVAVEVSVLMENATDGVAHQLSIADINGKLILRREVSSAELRNAVTIQVDYLSDGIYFIKLDSGGRSFTKKFVKL